MKWSPRSKRCHRERSTHRGGKGTFISCRPRRRSAVQEDIGFIRGEQLGMFGRAAKQQFTFYRQGPGVYAAKRARLRIVRDDNYPIGHQWTLLHRRQGKWHPVGNYRTKAEAEAAGHAYYAERSGQRARGRRASYRLIRRMKPSYYAAIVKQLQRTPWNWPDQTIDGLERVDRVVADTLAWGNIGYSERGEDLRAELVELREEVQSAIAEAQSMIDDGTAYEIDRYTGEQDDSGHASDEFTRRMEEAIGELESGLG